MCEQRDLEKLHRKLDRKLDKLQEEANNNKKRLKKRLLELENAYNKDNKKHKTLLAHLRLITIKLIKFYEKFT